jgi:phosphatidylglycerol---prolipoprotein diacylglyceryl transferase
MLRLVWNIDPVLLQIGPLQLHWYGLLFAAGILAAYQAGMRSFERAGSSREEAGRLLGYVVVGTVVGARLGHCLLYEPEYYLRHPLEILAVWRGGLASHGAFWASRWRYGSTLDAREGRFCGCWIGWR